MAIPLAISGHGSRWVDIVFESLPASDGLPHAVDSWRSRWFPEADFRKGNKLASQMQVRHSPVSMTHQAIEEQESVHTVPLLIPSDMWNPIVAQCGDRSLGRRAESQKSLYPRTPATPRQ